MHTGVKAEDCAENKHLNRTFQAPCRRWSARDVGGVPRAARQKEGAGRKDIQRVTRLGCNAVQTLKLLVLGLLGLLGFVITVWP